MEAQRDQNHVPTLLAVSSVDGVTPVTLYADPVTHRLLVDLAIGSGTVTEVSVVSANGFAGTVADPTTTPAITLTTTVTGIIKGNGTAMSAAVAGTDYTNQSFSTIAVSGQSNVVADSAADTLTLAAGTGITITTNATTDTITITNSSVTPPGGADTEVQFNDGGSFGGDAGFTYNKTTDDVTVAGDVSVGDDLLLPNSGSVINFNAGDMTITHSANTLTFAGGTVALGVATATTVNGLTITSSTGTLTITNGKTFSVSNTITLTGTDGASLNVDNVVTNASTSTDNAIARFDSTTGKIIQNSGVTVSDLAAGEYTISTPSVAGAGNLIGIIAGDSSGAAGGGVYMKGGTGNGANQGGNASVVGGVAGATGTGGWAAIFAGNGGATSGSGGDAHVTAGNATAGNSNGGNVNIRGGSKTGNGTTGKITMGLSGIGTVSYDFDKVTDNQTITVPNGSGWAVPTVPLVNMATLFENSARFTSIASGGTNTFGVNGLALTTTSTGSRVAGVQQIVAAGDIFSNTSIMTACIDITTVGTAGFFFIGVGDVSTAAEITNPHYGFKIEYTAGPTGTLYGSQAEGGTESKTASLTTVSAGQTLWLAAIKYGNNVGVTYYYRLNGGDWSSGTTNTNNVPTTATAMWLTAQINNASTATTNALSVQSYSLQR